jgi:hypothetical protein
MKTTATLIGTIVMESASDLYTISQIDGAHYISSKNGYHSGDKFSLMNAIKKVQKLIKNDNENQSYQDGGSMVEITDNSQIKTK